MQKLGTDNCDEFCPQFLSLILSPTCPFLSPVQSLETELGTKWGQNGDKNVNDSDKGSSEKHLLAAVFMQSMHDDMHES